MRKRKVRCFKGYGVANDTYNIEVFVVLPGFGYSGKLLICSKCGDIFFVSLNNMFMPDEDVIPLSSQTKCPRCDCNLNDTLLKYPDNVLISGGRVVQTKTISLIPNQDEGVIKEFWDLTEKLTTP